MHLVAADWRQADLSPANQSLCRYAERLTLEPAGITREDLDELRNHGFDDAAIHDASQVVGYFNYINRVADGLGIDEESFVRAWEQTAHSDL